MSERYVGASLFWAYWKPCIRHTLFVLLNHKKYDFSEEFTHNNISSCAVYIMSTSICAEFECDGGG